MRRAYSYLSVMLNNKADFILEYNEKKVQTLKRDAIDWSSSRVIFISPAFNSYQKNSVNFQDVPFELWEIRKFAGGLVALEKHQSSSTESISSITNSDGWIGHLKGFFRGKGSQRRGPFSKGLGKMCRGLG